MDNVKRLTEIYGNLKARHGFTTDESFMSAWRQDPIHWKNIFTVRQILINAMLNQ